jgi:hypothetical protein
MPIASGGGLTLAVFNSVHHETGGVRGGDTIARHGQRHGQRFDATGPRR